MFAAPTRILAADQRRQAYIAQAIHEQWVDQVLRPSTTGLATQEVSAQSSRLAPPPCRLHDTRSRLTRWATTVLGRNKTEAPSHASRSSSQHAPAW
jgi:hypothetical protein